MLVRGPRLLDRSHERPVDTRQRLVRKHAKTGDADDRMACDDLSSRDLAALAGRQVVQEP